MAGEREALDQALAAAGEDVILRRPAGVQPNAVAADVDVTCRAHIRTYRLRTEPLQSGISLADWLVILSPTEIFATNWPGSSSALLPDPQLPRKLDQVLFHGRTHTIHAVDPIYAAGELVRIELAAAG